MMSALVEENNNVEVMESMAEGAQAPEMPISSALHFGVTAFEEDEDVIPGPPPGNGEEKRREGASMGKSIGKSIGSSNRSYDRADLFLPPDKFAAGCNLLQAAATGNRIYMQELLTSGKANVNFRDYDRRTALHVAASEGHMVICKYLLEKWGAKVNRSDRWGGSPLDDAYRHRHHKVAGYLRQKGGTTGSGTRSTNLIKAAADGDADEVEMLLQVMPLADVNQGDYDKRTAMHLAAGEGRVQIVRALCTAGADVNAADRWGRRPLDDAIAGKHLVSQRVLIEHGAKVGENEKPALSPDDSSRRQSDNLRVDFVELEMIERIGAGAFGEIYKCRWRGTLVAAKIIKSAKIRKDWVNKKVMEGLKDGNDVDDAIQDLDDASMAQDEKDMAIQDFRQEISVLKALRHPHIVLLLAYSTTENYECLISELMKCSLLDVFRSHLVQGTKMRPQTQIVYATHLSLGMSYLHSCKPPVIHRDLKPANLLIDESGMLKITDFGLSKVRPNPETKEKDTFTMTGETGSYRFMAPEVFRHEDYNETVDVYSYGMILYQLLHGRAPWATLPGMDAVKQASEGIRPEISRDLDARLQYLLKDCWAENPQARISFTHINKILSAYSKDVFHTGENTILSANHSNSGCNCVIQ
jgi:serine/threonine protein kinase